MKGWREMTSHAGETIEDIERHDKIYVSKCKLKKNKFYGIMSSNLYGVKDIEVTNCRINENE